RRLLTILASLSLAVGLGACGGDDDGDDGGGDGGGDFRVAFILPGAVTDQGYNADGERAANQIRDELGAEVEVTESVQIPNQTDVYRQYANDGFNLVIGWGGQFTDGAVTAAEEFPDTQFLVVNSNAENGSNLSSMDTNIEQWQFFAGYLAAKLSNSGTVGYVGGQCFEATAANVNGTEQGAKYADPKVKFLATFTDDFEDPTTAQQTAQSLIDQGADVLTGNLNNAFAGVYEAARENGNLPVITEWVDNSDAAPEVIASSVLKSQARFVTELAKKAESGDLGGKFYLYPLPEDWGAIVSDTELLPDDLYQEALDVQQQVASGEIEVKRDVSCPS
ncbi:MAG: BMP family protein, partial [Solirubrobacterales bacterium]